MSDPKVNVDLGDTPIGKSLYDYAVIYKTMLINGVLVLEDWLDRAESIPGFKYCVSAFVDGFDSETVLKMYQAFEEQVLNFDWYFSLMKEFFIDSMDKFTYINYGTEGAETRLQESMKEIDLFVSQKLEEWENL